MYFSPSTGGFYTPDINGTNIPADVVEITAEQHATLLSGQADGQRIVADVNGFPTLQAPPNEPSVPDSVTMRQARLALLQDGLLDQVNAAVSAMPGPEGNAARIEWEFSSTVERHQPLVQSLSVALGMNESQLDQLFILAAAL
jgi:hypothetical protein